MVFREKHDGDEMRHEHCKVKNRNQLPEYLFSGEAPFSVYSTAFGVLKVIFSFFSDCSLPSLLEFLFWFYVN